MLKQHIDDPATDARIGLAGPVWGLGAGIAAYAVYRISGIPLWGAIAQLTGFINLFNLIPIWQLDGSRGFHALSRWQRWVVGALGAAFLVTSEGLLLLIGAVAVYRALQPAVVPEGCHPCSGDLSRAHRRAHLAGEDSGGDVAEGIAFMPTTPLRVFRRPMRSGRRSPSASSHASRRRA